MSSRSSVVSVFLALAALYESWALPLAVILVVPMCLLCSLFGVLYTGRDVNIFVQIGLVVLVGLACKNAILIVEYAKQKHLEGLSRHEATLEACRLRLRPILMTSFAFIIGVIPLAVATGAGPEMRRSLGIAVFSGMVGVTLFGIFLTPVFFSVIQGLSETSLLVPGGRAMGRLHRGRAVWRARGSASCSRRLPESASVALYWAIGLGGTAGVLAALAVPGHSSSESATQSPGCTPGSLVITSPETRGSPRESISRDFALLHRPSGLRHRALGRHRPGGLRGRVHAAGGPVSRGDAAHRAGDRLLSRGPTP